MFSKYVPLGTNPTTPIGSTAAGFPMKESDWLTPDAEGGAYFPSRSFSLTGPDETPGAENGGERGDQVNRGWSLDSSPGFSATASDRVPIAARTFTARGDGGKSLRSAYDDIQMKANDENAARRKT